MVHFGQYGRKIAIGIMLTASLAFIPCIPVQAAQQGTIGELAEHVYENADTDSNIVANVILGNNFPILAEETDESGNVWYLIETDMGVQGYIPAQSVIMVSTDVSNENRTERDTRVQETVPEEGNENENNLPDSVRKQLLTMEVVNIRENPSTNEEILGKIPRGTTLDYIDIITNEIDEVWYEVSYEDNHGYVKQSTVKEIEVPVQSTDGVQTYTAGMTSESIDIDLLIETARRYGNESPAEESEINANALEEMQSQEQIIDYDNITMEENTEQAKKTLSSFRPDMVIILSLAGILLCAVIISQFMKRMIKLHHQMNLYERIKNG